MLSILPARPKHLEELAKLYKKAFKKHNIFNQDTKAILSYLKHTQRIERDHFGGFMVALGEGPKNTNKVVGALLTRRTLESKTHERWQISHLAVDPKHQGNGHATQLVQSVIEDAKDMVSTNQKPKQHLKSIKIEAKVTTEKGVNLFRMQGFQVEGELHDHFRVGEKVILLGRTIK